MAVTTFTVRIIARVLSYYFCLYILHGLFPLQFLIFFSYSVYLVFWLLCLKGIFFYGLTYLFCKFFVLLYAYLYLHTNLTPDLHFLFLENKEIKKIKQTIIEQIKHMRSSYTCKDTCMHTKIYNATKLETMIYKKVTDTLNNDSDIALRDLENKQKIQLSLFELAIYCWV